MKKYHTIEKVSFDETLLVLIIDGQRKQFELKDLSPALATASTIERNTFEISPSGYGIHWPLLDEDISIDGLLGITHTPDRKKQIA
jgi:hypothetical protein